MTGILLLSLFLLNGTALAERLFAGESRHLRLWIGGVLGMIGMMWCVIPFSFLFGFTPLSHALGLLLMTGITWGVNRWFPAPPVAIEIRETFPRVLWLTIAGMSAIIFVLLFIHVLYPKPDGWYAGPGVFGDLPLHLGIITSIVEQQTFPPEYTIFPPERLGYPFLADSLSATFYLFGLSLRWAILIPGFVLGFLVVSGFVIFAREIVGKVSTTILAAALFFFNGGLGFIYFLEGLKTDPENFRRLFTGFYFTPTNWYEKNIFMFNVVCHILVPQRTALAGWAVFFLVLWLLHRSLVKKDRQHFLSAGILTGLLPMVHTYSFLIMGIIAATWFAVYFFPAENKGNYIRQWMKFVVPAGLLALPQILFWTAPQVGGQNFIRPHWNWENNQDAWMWFWVKNAGLPFILVLPAFMSASPERRRFYSGAVVLFVFAETFAISMYPVNNNKIFYVWLAFTVILVAEYVTTILERLKGMGGRVLLAGFFVIISTASGGLTVAHDMVTTYVLYSNQDVAMAEFVRTSTQPDALFITGNDHYHQNPVAALAGRKVFCGDPLFLSSHGIDPRERSEILKEMYTQPQAFPSLQAKHGIDYVLFGYPEQTAYQVDGNYFEENYPKVFSQGGTSIYAVSRKARGLSIAEK